MDLKYVKVERRRHHIWAFMLFGSVAVFAVTTFFVFGTVVVHGRSMEPAFRQGQMLFMNRWVYFFRDPVPGEIVVFKDPQNPKSLDVKRVIALPKDTVQIYAGSLYVNGSKLDEYYLKKDTVTVAHKLDEKTYEVINRSYFLMGDNREESLDSRDFGGVQRDAIVGRVARY